MHFAGQGDVIFWSLEGKTSSADCCSFFSVKTTIAYLLLVIDKAMMRFLFSVIAKSSDRVAIASNFDCIVTCEGKNTAGSMCGISKKEKRSSKAKKWKTESRR